MAFIGCTRTSVGESEIVKYSLDGVSIFAKRAEVEDSTGSGTTIPEPPHPESDGSIFVKYPQDINVRYTKNGLVDSVEGKVLLKERTPILKQGEAKTVVFSKVGSGLSKEVENDGREFVSYGFFYVWFREDKVDRIKLVDNSLRQPDLSGYE